MSAIRLSGSCFLMLVAGLLFSQGAYAAPRDGNGAASDVARSDSTMPLLLSTQDEGYEEGYEEGYSDEGGYGEEGRQPEARGAQIQLIEEFARLPVPGLSANWTKKLPLGRFAMETETVRVRRKVEIEEPVVEEDAESGEESEGDDSYSEEEGGDSVNEGEYMDEESSEEEYGGVNYDEEGYGDDYGYDEGESYDSGPRYETIEEEFTEPIPWRLSLISPAVKVFQPRHYVKQEPKADDGYGNEYDEGYGEGDYEYGGESDEGESSGEDYGYGDEGEYGYGGSGDTPGVINLEPGEEYVPATPNPADMAACDSPNFDLQAVSTPGQPNVVSWKLRAKQGARLTDVAILQRNDSSGALYFEWTKDATIERIAPLRYHVLVVETGEGVTPIGFSNVDALEPVLVSCNKGFGEADLTLRGLPSTANLCLQVTGVQGYETVKVNPPGAVLMGLPQTVAIQPDLDGTPGKSVVALQVCLQKNETSGGFKLRVDVAKSIVKGFLELRQGNMGSTESLTQIRNQMARKLPEMRDLASKARDDRRQEFAKNATRYYEMGSMIDILLAVHSKPAIGYRVLVNAGGFAFPIAEFKPAANASEE